MASGYRDYWTRVMSQKSLYSTDQIVIQKTALGNIASGDTDTFINYTVPAGYAYHVLSATIGCRGPGTNFGMIATDAGQALRTYFDTVYNYPFSEGNDLVVNAGEKLYVTFENYLDETWAFLCVFNGYLQYVG